MMREDEKGERGMRRNQVNNQDINAIWAQFILSLGIISLPMAADEEEDEVEVDAEELEEL